MKIYFEDNVAYKGLAQKCVRGGVASIFGRTGMGICQVLSVLFLARLLSPEDYGLVAMATAITGFAPILVDLGTRDAIVQRPRINEGEVSALFWITSTFGCSLAALVAVSGSLIARFYSEPKLETIVAVSSLAFVLTALSGQHQALLRRAVKFRELATIDVVANLLSVCIAIGMAYRGFGYWSLVFRPVSMYAISTLGLWFQCRWLPGRPVFNDNVKEMLKFGFNITGFSMADFVGRNIDRVAIGKGLGAKVLGYYQNALFVYYNLLDILVFTLHQVAVASLSKLHDRPDDLRRAWAKALSTVAFVAMPIFGLLAVTGPDLIVILLGKKWAGAGAILGILALRGIPHSVERTAGWLHVTAGRPERWMRWGLVSMMVQFGALLCGVPFGIKGIACAYVLSMFVLFIPGVVYAGRPLDIMTTDVIRAVGRQLAAALLAAGAGYLLRYLVLDGINGLVRLSVLAATYLIVYCGVVFGILGLRTPLLVIGPLLHEIVPHRIQTLLRWSIVAPCSGLNR